VREPVRRREVSRGADGRRKRLTRVGMIWMLLGVEERPRRRRMMRVSLVRIGLASVADLLSSQRIKSNTPISTLIGPRPVLRARPTPRRPKQPSLLRRNPVRCRIHRARNKPRLPCPARMLRHVVSAVAEHGVERLLVCPAALSAKCPAVEMVRDQAVYSPGTLRTIWRLSHTLYRPTRQAWHRRKGKGNGLTTGNRRT
jgi:hypothetical protein